MAARLNKLHSDHVRSKIQCAKLINLLTDHASGKIELSPTQVQSAKILLDKSISNAPTEIIAEINIDVEFTQTLANALKDIN